MSAATTEPAPEAPPVGPHNGYGITSLVCGIVAACVGLGPVIVSVALGIPLGLIGFSFAVANRGRLNRGQADNRRMTITGGMLSVVGVGLGVIGVVLLTLPADPFVQV